MNEEPKERPMPVTHRGGTRATAMATPAIEFEILARVNENDPAIAAAIATPKSIRLGVIRFQTSLLTWAISIILAIVQDVPITRRQPINIVNKDLVVIVRFEIAIPNAMLKIGSINGATIIAPMITAELFAKRPNVAIAAALISSTRYATDNLEAVSRPLYNSLVLKASSM